MKRFSLCALALFLAMMSSIAGAANIDELVTKLVGADVQDRARARQLLPREGAAALPALLPLLGNGDPGIVEATFDIILDISNQSAAPGREAERRLVTDTLIPLIADERTEAEKLVGLRLLERLVPAGYDIAPIAKLFGETPLLRDRARTALERIATEEARVAIRAALADAPPEFQWGLLTSLYELRDEKSLPQARALTKSSDWRVRSRAARCLTWVGNPEEAPIIKDVIKVASDEKSRAGAVDSLLRLAQGMARKPSTQEAARVIYLELLTDKDISAQEAALAGLGRVGNGESVGPVLKTLGHTEPRVRRAGLAALRSMSGKDVVKALVEAYPKQTQYKAELLVLLASKRDPQTLALLLAESKSLEPAVRLAALKGFGEAGLAEGVKPLKEAASGGSAEEKKIACESLIALAQSLRENEKRNEAGEAYAAVLNNSPDEALRQSAIEGLSICPAQAAFDGLMAAALDKALAGKVVPALLGVAHLLVQAGEKDKAIQCCQKVIELEPAIAEIRQAAALLKSLGVELEGLPSTGTITQWWVLGFFPLESNNRNWEKDLIGEPRVVIETPVNVAEKAYEWKPVSAIDDVGKVNLLTSIGQCTDCVGYAYTEVSVKEETDAILQLGVDDSEKIWVNGEKVFDLFVARGMTPDADQVPIHLKAGSNTILLKIWQLNAGWEFCARITTRDGKALRFTQRSQ